MNKDSTFKDVVFNVCMFPIVYNVYIKSNLRFIKNQTAELSTLTSKWGQRVVETAGIIDSEYFSEIDCEMDNFSNSHWCP